jgi:cyclopropane-fatty-acyl-phospholipid synthase
MIAEAPRRIDKTTVKSRQFLERVLGQYDRQNVAVRLWDGTIWRNTGDHRSPAPFTLALKHPAALRRMFLPPTERRLAEAYIYGDFDIEGEIEEAIPLGHDLMDTALSAADIVRWGWRLLAMPADGRPRRYGRAARLSGSRHTIDRDRQAIAYHYNVSNRFYALWLDRQMIYSCAYFSAPDEDLDRAQVRKLQYLCKKLRLTPGDTLLDIGCGWGALIMHAAQHYGVKALGITLSEPQAEWAAGRIKERGLAGVCRVEVRDYRELSPAERFDKIVSVGMCEHVGEALLPTYFAKAYDLLRPGGVFLNHAIAQRANEPTAIGQFAHRYVFPDGQLVPIGTAVQAAERSGFHVRDVESLREHYELTFRQWRRRLEAKAREAVAETDEVTYRIWRLSLAGLAYWFQQGRFDLYQTLLSKPDTGLSRLPLTRADWYT